MIDYSRKLFFSPEEAAGLIPLSAQTIRLQCIRRLIPGARKHGRRWLIPRESIERLGSIPKPPISEPTRPVSEMNEMEREAFFLTRDELLRPKRKVS